MKHILLIEDDSRLAELVESFLKQHSFNVTIINDGLNAVSAIRMFDPDLVLLDIMLPNVDGFSICRQVRANYQKPILFLTAKDSDLDQVMGLEMGADDYIIKPVDPHVLLARINTVLRRAGNKANSNSQQMIFGNLDIDKSARKVLLAETAIELTSHEYELLVLLAENAGDILSRDQVHQAMIGREYDGLDRTVDVRISRLRKKLGDDPQNPARIITVWGKGYTLNPGAWD